MSGMSENPFEVTKAVDFTDAEIAATWVDLPGGGFPSLADPRSPMPTFLVGGKGGGRTHLLRHFSFALQRLRHPGKLLEGIQEEGYLGVYLRCAGLNSSRFRGKQQSEETWAAVFSYYMEIWLGGLTLDLIAQICAESPEAVSAAEIERFAGEVAGLFDLDLPVRSSEQGSPLRALIQAFRGIQRDLDVAINNAALDHRLDVRVGSSPGRIVFGIPKAVTDTIPAFSGLAVAYLIDEFENLTEDQQKYVNTLVREKQLPTSFIIGSRLFGLRTHQTLAADEENKRGSEFALVVLETAYRASSHRYWSFCEEIVRRRLRVSGVDVLPQAKVASFFVDPALEAGSVEELARRHTADCVDATSDRPWMARLKDQLGASGYGTLVASVVSAVSLEDNPLIEKFAIFLLYRAWADGEDLVAAGKRIRRLASSLASGDERTGKTLTTYRHYRQDLYAQLLADLKLPQEYCGLDSFIRMSGYLPRNALVVLKQITRWSLFQGEQPFRGNPISVDAQQEGVREASTWFLSDAKGLGRIGEETQFAVRRLGSLFREMRFADKPVEVSCSAFSTDRRGLSPTALACLDEAVSHSLILEIPIGRRDRNSRVLDHKYQLNPMLAPLFDLSLALRGSADFGAGVLNAVFDPGDTGAFEAGLQRVVTRMQAPFSRVAPQSTLGLE